MNLLKKTTYFLGAVLCSLTLATSVSASSRGVVWNLYTGSQGAFLSAKAFASFLGSEEVSETLIFSASCNPQTPTPYATAVMRIPQGQTAPPSSNLQVWFPGGNYLFLGGYLDQIASVNAGDNKPRYGFNVTLPSALFNALMENGSRFHPKVDMGDAVQGKGAKLEIFDRDRQKVRDFVATCTSFAQQNPGTSTTQREAPYACRDFLNGPNSFNGNQAVNYGNQIADRLCGQARMDVRPAVCMHQVMANRIPWNQQGATNWDAENAADLCHQTSNPAGRISCFSGHINAGVPWNAGITACKFVN
ncbi:MAG: hypothetical protein ABJO09_07595 [Hyphomicrobiales bacterium]